MDKHQKIGVGIVVGFVLLIGGAYAIRSDTPSLAFAWLVAGVALNVFFVSLFVLAGWVRQIRDELRKLAEHLYQKL